MIDTGNTIQKFVVRFSMSKHTHTVTWIDPHVYTGTKHLVTVVYSPLTFICFFYYYFFYITRCTILTLSIAHIAWFTHNDQLESLNELNDIERRLLCDSTGHDISDHVSLLDSEQWMERNYVIIFWRLIYRLLWFGNWLYK